MRRLRGSQLVIYTVLILLAGFSLGPLVLMVLNSFRSRLEISMDPMGWPDPFRWQNYVNVWRDASLGTALTNSLMVTGLTVLLTCIVASMAAYALARKRIRAWSGVSLYLLVCTTVPVQLFLIPLFFIFHRLGLVNSRAALAVIYTALTRPSPSSSCGRTSCRCRWSWRRRPGWTGRASGRSSPGFCCPWSRRGS